MAENETQPATHHRRRSARDHFVESLALMSRYAQPRVDPAKLRQMMDLGDEEYTAQTTKIMTAIAVALGSAEPPHFTQCPKCDAPLEPESPEIAIENLARWQKARSPYHQWSPYEIRQLLDHLHQHPGSVLIPTYAQSVGIREPSGRVYTFRRDGKVT